uniref:Rho guanine nucleotide exchange factor 15b n=1 Tax=Electrophorus electricus TaxID=8005 RepID=A0A4W4GF80_ELEEL
MKLVWVPIPDDEKVGEEKEVRQGCLAEPRPEEHPKECAGEDESETSDTEEDEDEDEETTSGSSEEEEKCEDKAPLTNKEKFQVTLDLIEGQLRRTSDPGPEVALTSVKPLPQTSPIKANSFPEEESIYEASLDLLTVPRDASLQVLVIPPCQITTEGEAECSPPDIPPRMPLDKAKTPRFPRSTPLAQMQVPSVSKLPPAVDSPPRSPKPLRPAPAPPILAKANSRHLIKLLYQVYTESYITKEIRRQTVCRNISKTSMDFQIEFPRIAASSGTGAGGSRSSPVPSLQSTLWQDLPAVRESGILQTLTPEECKYQESMFEVLTSEVSYLRSLRVLTDHFLDSWELNETLINLDKKTLFSNILRIREVSEKFLKDLEERLDERRIRQPFATVIARLQEAPKCQRLPFVSFLLLPFQRITRIKMLIENILKRTAVGTKEEESASKALASVSKIIAVCNTEVGKMKQVEELIQINKMLEFDKLKAVPIISQNRFLEKRGELQELAKGATLFNLKPRFSPVFLFLFNDLLIIANKKGAERYVVMDHAHRSLVQVQEHSEDSPSPSLENCFNLTLLENHQGRMMERLLKTPLSPVFHATKCVFVYVCVCVCSCSDCPQVQCVEQYVANQTDELNLDPPEIINVIRKANEGESHSTFNTSAEE